MKRASFRLLLLSLMIIGGLSMTEVNAADGAVENKQNGSQEKSKSKDTSSKHKRAKTKESSIFSKVKSVDTYGQALVNRSTQLRDLWNARADKLARAAKSYRLSAQDSAAINERAKAKAYRVDAGELEAIELLYRAIATQYHQTADELQANIRTKGEAMTVTILLQLNTVMQLLRDENSKLTEEYTTKAARLEREEKDALYHAKHGGGTKSKLDYATEAPKIAVNRARASREASRSQEDVAKFEKDLKALDKLMGKKGIAPAQLLAEAEVRDASLTAVREKEAARRERRHPKEKRKKQAKTDASKDSEGLPTPLLVNSIGLTLADGNVSPGPVRRASQSSNGSPISVPPSPLSPSTPLSIGVPGQRVSPTSDQGVSPLQRSASVALIKHDDVPAARELHHAHSFAYGGERGRVSSDADGKSFSSVITAEIEAAKQVIGQQLAVKDGPKRNYAMGYLAEVFKGVLAQRSDLQVIEWQSITQDTQGIRDLSQIRLQAHKIWDTIFSSMPREFDDKSKKVNKSRLVITEADRLKGEFRRNPATTLASVFSDLQGELKKGDGRNHAKNSAARVFTTGGTYGLDFAKPVDRDERTQWIKGLRRFGIEQGQDSDISRIYVDLRNRAFPAPTGSSRDLLEHQTVVYMGWVMGYWCGTGRIGKLLRGTQELDSEFQRAYGALGGVPGILEGVRPIINDSSHSLLLPQLP